MPALRCANPSLLSDWMLRANFRKQERGTVFHYGVSPGRSAGLSDRQRAAFDQYKAKAIPPVFLDRLEELERRVDFGFVDRWRHDWEWLQRDVSR